MVDLIMLLRSMRMLQRPLEFLAWVRAGCALTVGVGLGKGFPCFYR